MDQYEAFLVGLVSCLSSAFLIFLITYCTREDQETLEEDLKCKEKKLELHGYSLSKKDKKKKLKKMKVHVQVKSKTEKRLAEESSDADTEVSECSPVISNVVMDKSQANGKSLSESCISERLLIQKANASGSSEMKDCSASERLKTKTVSRTAEPKAVQKWFDRTHESNKRGRMEELDEIYLVDVGNWSYLENASDVSDCSEYVLSKDEKKRMWSDRNVSGTAIHDEDKTKKCCQEWKINLDNVRKQFQDQKSEIEMLHLTIHAFNSQHLNETSQLRTLHEQEMKKLVDENRKVKEENRTTQEAIIIKNRQLESMNASIDDLNHKIDVMESALQTNARMYNSSENARKNSESRVKQFEARIRDLESTVRCENIIAQKINDITRELKTKSDMFEKAMVEVETLKKENEALIVFQHHCDELQVTIGTLETEKETLKNENQISVLHIAELAASMMEEKETARQQMNELEERLKEKEAENKKKKESEMSLTKHLDQLQRYGIIETKGNKDSTECQRLLEQLHLAQNEVKKLEKELKIIKGSTENLGDIDFAYRCVEKSLTNIVDEMEEKVQDLQDRLDAAEADKLETFLQLSQLRATHELVLSELHDLRQTVIIDSFKADAES